MAQQQLVLKILSPYSVSLTLQIVADGYTLKCSVTMLLEIMERQPFPITVTNTVNKLQRLQQHTTTLVSTILLGPNSLQYTSFITNFRNI